MGVKRKKHKYEYSYRLYVGKGDDGKYHYKRFTGYSDKSMKQAMLDAQVKAEMHRRTLKISADRPCITLRRAYTEYIAVKSNILSPSTIRAYNTLLNNTFQQIMDIPISDLSQIMVQSAVNQLAANHSAKYVKNAHGLLTAVLSMYRPDFVLHSTMPRAKKVQAPIPENDDITKLLEYVKSREDHEMYKAILLAAFGSLRRSEICALLTSDIHMNKISISKAVVPNLDEEYVVKDTTKSEAGTREVTMPDNIICKMTPEEGTDRIVNINPGVLSLRFRRYVRDAGIQHFRFHDLRHYQASILHAMGVPDKYIMERCGWKTDSVMKNIYQHTMKEKRKQVESEICDYFSDTFGDMI